MPARSTRTVARPRAYCPGNRTGRRGAMDLRRSRRHMGHTLGMQDAFGYVLFATVILGGLGAIVTACMTGAAYKEIGKGGFFSDDRAAMPRVPAGRPVDLAERDDEIRQMLTARNARRAAA